MGFPIPRRDPYGAGDEYLVRLGLCHNARADVDRNSADLAVDQLTLAGVKTGSDFDAELRQGVADSAGTADGACRPVEAREEAIPGRVDLAAPKTSELTTHA